MRGWPGELHTERNDWIDSLGLDARYMPAEAEIVIDLAEHLITTRYVVTPEGSKPLKKGEVPESISDGGTGVITTPHSEPYKAKTLPEVPAKFHNGLDDASRAALGV
jgi:hypothetical protein